jgi:uncharacterized paraquat-inducible protein A
MTRLVARLILAMLLLPITGTVVLFNLLLMAASGAPGPPRVERVLLLWATTYAVIAVYWILLWRGVVRWTQRRVAWTVYAGAVALCLGAGAAAIILLASRGQMPPGPALLIGGGTVPILWVLATVLIWRESAHERFERLNQLSNGAVCCPICGYNMTGLSAAHCPECGAKFTLDQLFTTQPRAAKAEGATVPQLIGDSGKVQN